MQGIPQFTQINTNGFGDWQNCYSWSMAWFQGKLYVGTNRYSDLQAISAQYPFVGQLEGFPNQVNDGAAEIWSYTPETETWAKVYKSPTDIPIPNQPPGTFAAEDNGFRTMAVFTEADGTEALYVGGVVYPGAAPGVNVQARILRSTDGINFTPIPEDSGTFLGVDSFRGMTVYQGRLYVIAAIGSELGPGVIFEAANPAGGDDNFRQVSPPDLDVFEMQVFNGFLYVGTAETSLGVGYSVLKTDASPSPTNPSYYNFIPVVTHGGYYYGTNLGGRPFIPFSVLSMAVFQGDLYVGSSTDLIRIEPNDTWELIVGNPRLFPEGVMYPISGLPNGFGNPFVIHLWRMAVYQNRLYVGTLEESTFFQPLPFIGPIASREAGFDLWTTAGGVHWTAITRNGFGDPLNVGVVRNLVTPVGLFLGTVNPWEGTQVWLGV